jgi:hypothetical protein
MALETKEQDTRAAGLILIAAFLATLALLANHPGGGGATFADVLRNEAKDARTDAIVHGGYIAVMGIEFVCFSVFARRLGLQRMLSLAGLIFTAAGFAFLAGSMLLDGLVIPAIAQRFAGAAVQKLDMARALFLLCGIAISFLMPIGMLFQAAGVSAWSFALTTGRGLARGIGVLGILGAAVLFAAVGAASLYPAALMGGFLVTALWALAVGILLAARKI